MRYPAVIFFIVAVFRIAHAQDTTLTLSDAIRKAIEKNPSVEATRLETLRQITLERTAFELPKTDVSLLYGQYNSIQKGDNNLTISQSIPFPTLFARQKALNKTMTTVAMLQENITRNELTFQVKQVFNQLLYLNSLHRSLAQQDSLLSELLRIARVRYGTGEGTLLAITAAETQLLEIRNTKSRNATDKEIALNHLQQLCQSPAITDVTGNLETFSSVSKNDSLAIQDNPSLAYMEQQVELSNKHRKVEIARTMPDLRVGYFNQTLIGTQNVNGQDQYFSSTKRFQGFQAGISFPLWFAPQTARIKAASVATEVAKKQAESFRLNVTQQYYQALQELSKNNNSLSYYKDYALKAAELLVAQSRLAFRSGDIDQTALLLNIKQALAIREGYLIALLQYNKSMITIDYLTGKM